MAGPTFDVQRALAAMADYPAVLRRFGVIRVLEVDLAGSGIDLAGGPVTVSATPTWSTKLPAPQVDVAPVTTPAFLSASRFALAADGRVDPAAAKLDVAEVDTDSAVIRLVDLARLVVNAEVANAAAAAADPPRLPPVSLPKQLALPSLRNAGLSVFQGDRAVGLRGRLVAGKALYTATGPHTLADASHALKGFVLDVWDDRTKRWHTVCARRGTYQLPGGQSFTLDDEGTISLATTAKPAADGRSPMYLHQSLVRWTGYSLVAPRPGQPVTTETEGSEPTAGGPALPGFTVTFTPQPGTLPRLRFGVGYRFQLRSVDVAGHADPLDPASTDFSRAVPASPARYLRFEPVVAPVVVASAPMTEGESVETLVIRPDPWLGGIVGSLLAPILGTQPARHLAPPKVSQLLCEEHGMFDDGRGVPDPSRYGLIAQRDAADLSTVGTPDPGRAGQRYFSGAALPVTWLPDPLSRGAALAGLPGGVVKVPFDPALLRAWPDVQSVRLQLVDGTANPSWNPLTRILTVSVPRGETRTARLSSYVNTGDLAALGHLGWLSASGAPAAVITAANADVVAGRAWQITPYRTLTLVNAVRVPLQPPVLQTIAPPDPAKPRTAGATTQALTATANVHRPSTGTLTLRATWTDPVDDPSKPAGPDMVTSTATPPVVSSAGTPAPELTVGYDPDPVTGAQVAFSATQSFGDTRRHQVSYSLVGTTRYMEYFTQRGQVTLQGTTPAQVSTVGIAPGSDTVRSVDGAVTYRREVDYDVKYPAGTIARMEGGAIPSGTTVEVAIVTLPVSVPSGGAPLVVDVRSTARPMPPQVGWIVPTFGWTESTTNFGRTKTRTRSGGGLRVFLERPWFSSGVGEQLAVVLADGAAPDDQRLVPLVTQLGADPVVVSEAPGAFPAPAAFPLATIRKGGVAPVELAETTLAGRTVAVAAHDVVWDAERQRWACDVVLPPGRSYQPFVRLSLARYQPHSVSGVELSPVASVEWAQLAPDRSATVLLDLIDLTKVTIRVAGRSAGGTVAAANQPNAVSVIVQTASGLNPADLDWDVVGPADGQPLAASAQPDGTTLWTGTLRLPTLRLLKPYRLVVTEREQFEGGGRLVYSDVIRL